MPGGGREAATAGPLLEHLVESIADGASWQNEWKNNGVAKKSVEAKPFRNPSGFVLRLLRKSWQNTLMPYS